MGISPPPPRPLSLHIVTFIIIAIGAISCLATLSALVSGRVYLNVNAVALVFGLGLAFLRGWARTCTILYAVIISMIAMTGVLDALLDLRIIRVTYQGMPTNAHSIPGPVIAICFVAAGLMIWTILTLLRNDVSLLFGDRFHLQPLEKRPRIDEARAETDSV
jgi:hypothetical protein